MNFISWNKAYSLFPQATFENHVLISFNPSDMAMNALNKYYDQGWELLTGDDLGLLRNNFFPTRRQIGDRFTWVLPLCTQGIDSALTYRGLSPDVDYFRGNTFNLLLKSISDYQGRKFAIQYSIYTNPILWHSYTISVVTKGLILPRIKTEVQFEYGRIAENELKDYDTYFLFSRSPPSGNFPWKT